MFGPLATTMLSFRVEYEAGIQRGMELGIWGNDNARFLVSDKQAGPEPGPRADTIFDVSPDTNVVQINTGDPSIDGDRNLIFRLGQEWDDAMTALATKLREVGLLEGNDGESAIATGERYWRAMVDATGEAANRVAEAGTGRNIEELRTFFRNQREAAFRNLDQWASFINNPLGNRAAISGVALAAVAIIGVAIWMRRRG